MVEGGGGGGEWTSRDRTIREGVPFAPWVGRGRGCGLMHGLKIDFCADQWCLWCVPIRMSVCLYTEEKQSRLGKNPKRVGANFRQQVAMETNEDWLPNFGQVWSFGPRSQSR